MFRIVVALFTLIVFCEQKNTDSEKCYDPEQNFYPYMGSKTSYRYIRNNITRLPSNCKPLQIWMMSRHGARYPSVAIIEKVLSIGETRDQIVRNYEQGVSELCAKDAERLHRWYLDSKITKENAETLAPQGKKDLQMLAQRLRNVFPKLLKSNNSHEYSFTSTERESARYSLQAFAAELVGSDKGLEKSLEVTSDNDTILLAHLNCPAWVYSFEAERVYAERNKFTTGPEVQQLLKNVSKRLGFSNTLNFETTRLMYEMCRLETSWNPDEPSPWCALFTKNELSILEYREDLDYYYCCGPGNKLNAKLNCPNVKNMFQHFERIENGNTREEPKGIFYFGHSTNIQSLMSALNIGQELPLLASKFDSSQNRIYRSSIIGPFSANFIAVLYKCNDVTSPYKVTFHLNENLVKMDGCDDGICDWQFLKRKFLPKIKSCSLDFCYEGLPKGRSFVFTGFPDSRYHSDANRQNYNVLVAVLSILSYVIKQFLL